MTFSGSTSPASGKSNDPLVYLNFITVPGINTASGMSSATISLWVEWNGVQPRATVGGDGNSWSMYGAVLGTGDPVPVNMTAIGLNYNGNPASNSGLRLCADSGGAWDGGVGTSADLSTTTVGCPQNGTGYAAPGNNTWTNIVLVASGTSWTIYQNGVALRTVTAGGNLFAAPGSTSAPLYLGADLFVDSNGDPRYGGSNSMLDDVGIFTTNLTDGKAKAIYKAPTSGITQLSQYNLGVMDKLFQVYGGSLASDIEGSLTWVSATGLGHNAGDVWTSGGVYYMQFDSSGGGVEATVIPEPVALVLLAVGLSGLLAYAWRKRK